MFVVSLFSQFSDSLWAPLSLLVLVLAMIGTGLILWRRYSTRRLLMRRIAELESLSAAGRAIVAAELDVHALCALIAAEASKIMETDTFQVGLFEKQYYRILYWTIAGEAQDTPQSFDLSEDPGIVGWVRESQKPLVIQDFERDLAEMPARPRYVSESPPRSALFVPLISGEETIGIVAAQSQEANRFQEEDMRRLMILANQAAAAIANGRLYEQERMRAAHLELVSQIARQVNAVQDRDEIFEQVVTLTQQTFNFFPVSIFDLDPQTGDAVLQASSDPNVSANSARIPANMGIVGAAAALGETIVCNNTADDPRYITSLQTQQTAVEHLAQAEIAIPLIVDDKVLGVLDVQSDQVGAFTESEQMVLEALAAEVASAIHKAQQLAWQQRQAWVTTAQLQVAEAINRSDDLDEMITSVTRLTPMLTGVSICGMLLWDAEMEHYIVSEFHSAGGAVEAIPEDALALGAWPALDAVHVGQQPINTEQVPPWLSSIARQLHQPLHGVYLFPMTASRQSQPQGVLVVDNFVPDTFMDDESMPGQRRYDLLQNVARQSGQALESARLRLAQQEEAWVNTALLQVAQAVNSLIDLNEILDTIVRLVPMLVGVKSAVILTRDDERELFVTGPSFGIDIMGRGLLETLELSDSEYEQLIGSPIDTQQPAELVYTLQPPHWLRTVLRSPSACALSLNAQGRVVGAMLVGTEGQRLPTRRVNILNGIAQQAATAVVNNQLYKESAERLRLEQELNVAHEIQASFLPTGSPDIPGLEVASLWLAARQVSGDFYDFLARSDGSWGMVIADVADKGVPAALFMALSRTILRTVGINRSDPAEVLMRVNEIISIDAESDLFVTVFYATWDPVTSELSYASGGHNPPLLMHANGKHRWLQTPGMALGILPEIEMESSSVTLQPGDTLVMFTDGVTEAINEDFDEFGNQRLVQTMRSVRRQNPQQIIAALTAAVRDHAGDTPQYDDLTLVVAQRKR
jgi:serine phosphatase RsbU (regulator of sigma subunit)/putative methionine-R-sulfoxide reductase with GAF domain